MQRIILYFWIPQPFSISTRYLLYTKNSTMHWHDLYKKIEFTQHPQVYMYYIVLYLWAKHLRYPEHVTQSSTMSQVWYRKIQLLCTILVYNSWILDWNVHVQCVIDYQANWCFILVLVYFCFCFVLFFCCFFFK